jgi:EAL domain-containing protein (putative c-di-GMP-specific phosphodiesterase class I)
MADPKRTIGMLTELAAMGLHLSIDDFGTGYSSLSALQQFPIGTLKVDQSFVRNVNEDRNNATIVRTIIEMGHSLGMQVVAEGVETAPQLEFLKSAGCDQAQGQLFGEPCSIEALSQLLARQVSMAASPFPHFARKQVAGGSQRA